MPNTLDYGPPPQRNLKPSTRDVAGALFLVLAAAAGLLGLVIVVGVLGTYLAADSDAPITLGELMLGLGIGVLGLLLSLGAVIAGIRRLNPKRTMDRG